MAVTHSTWGSCHEWPRSNLSDLKWRNRFNHQGQDLYCKTTAVCLCSCKKIVPMMSFFYPLTHRQRRCFREFGSKLHLWRHVGLLMSMLLREPHTGAGVMVWAGINYGQRTQLQFINGNLNAQRYCDEILRTIVMPCICCLHLMFQHDNTIPGSWKCPSYSIACILTRHHPFSMLGMLWIDMYNSVFQFPPISGQQVA